MEASRMPFAVYQFVDRRVVTLILSDGFCDLFGYDDRAKAYYDMDNDMYKDAHPDDTARIAEDALQFATKGGVYDTVYRSRIPGTKDYRIIHAIGEHFNAPTGDRLAMVWYTNEGKYNTGNTSGETVLNQRLSETMHEQSIIRASNFDFLTGLPSMAHFFDLAETARTDILRRGGNPVLMFMDLSGMKFYNRKYGFSKGDELLVNFSRLLAGIFGNDNCCRIGEDHFSAVSEEDGVEDRIKKLFAEWEDLYGSDALAVRVGIYRNSMEVVDASSACDRAKYACDSLRNNYTSCISWFDANMLYEANGKQYIIENIDKAIKEKWIKPYYQAIVRSTSGKVCDEEALARWMDPEKGMLSPAMFVPVLEEAGLIYKLDLYMIEQVLIKLRTMRDMGMSTNPVSVNLSRRDFESCDIIDEICKRVDAAGFDHSVLNIEITESTVARDVDYIKSQVERFRELGFHVWMDDFGSGYSSLDVLQNIPFDLIKFDMHFMQQFDSGDEAKIILTELMKMANGLGIDTICEGVEREDQVQFLREIGCSKIQGYYYERPVSFEDLMKKFEAGHEIGVENPAENEYYEAIGRINLYDLSMIASRDESELGHYFDTLPMAIIEINGEEARFARSNHAYREFIRDLLGLELPGNVGEFRKNPKWIRPWFLDKVRECCSTNSSTIVDEKRPDNTTVHTYLRKIADNPVTGTSAVAVAVLSINETKEDITYANIARALAADYVSLYYVDLETDEFIEYASNSGRETMAVERRDTDFFNKARKDALDAIYEEDLDYFLRMFSKENILNALDQQKSFTLSYRLMMKGRPVYMNIKAMRMQDDEYRIIIGVSDVNLQMNQRKAIERLMQEQTVSNRIRALTDDFMVMYTIDPETGSYTESTVNSEYEGLGVAKVGDDFFGDKDINADRLVHPEDAERFKRTLDRDNILDALKKNGLVKLKYRLMINGEPKTVMTRAALVREADGEKLLVSTNYVSD